jgi:hypothetical protein
MARPLVVFIDVDDTLVRSVGEKRIPMPRVVEHVRSLHASGAELYLWSTGGSTYARETATELGVGDCFVGFLPKPEVLIDDQLVTDWNRLLQIGPLEAGSASVDDYVARLG